MKFMTYFVDKNILIERNNSYEENSYQKFEWNRMKQNLNGTKFK